MKKRLISLCLSAAAVSILAACGGTDVTESTVELKKNGKIVEYTMEDFAESYYDADELKSFIQSEVDAYLEENDGSIKVSKSEVEEQTAYLTMQYDSADTFSDFNGIDCFAGSIVQARSAGYDFDADFIDVASGDTDADPEVSVDEIEILPVVPADIVLEDDDLKVFIIKDDVDIIVPGTIVYVSADHTEVTDSNRVSVSIGDEETGSDVLVYVLYK